MLHHINGLCTTSPVAIEFIDDDKLESNIKLINNFCKNDISLFQHPTSWGTQNEIWTTNLQDESPCPNNTSASYLSCLISRY